MRLVLLVVLTAVCVTAQTTTSGSLGPLPSGVPLCALSCATLFFSSNSQCPTSSDTSCLCSSSTFLDSATSCILESCSTTSDQQAAYSYAVSVCADAGVTLPSFSQLTASASPGRTAQATSDGSGLGSVRTTLITIISVLFCVLLGFFWA